MNTSSDLLGQKDAPEKELSPLTARFSKRRSERRDSSNAKARKGSSLGGGASSSAAPAPGGGGNGNRLPPIDDDAVHGGTAFGGKRPMAAVHEPFGPTEVRV